VSVPFSPLHARAALTQRREILSQNTRDSRLSCGENSKSLFHLVLKRYRDVTHRHKTPRQNHHG